MGPDDVADAMAHVLEKPVAPGDDFFALGGDSVAASQLCAELEARTGTRWPESMVVQAPTPRALAAAMDRPEQDVVLPLQAGGTLPPLLVVFGASGYVFGAQRLAAALGPDQPVFGIQPRTAADRDPAHAVAEVTRLIAARRWSVLGVGPASRAAHLVVRGLEALGHVVDVAAYVDVHPWPVQVTDGPVRASVLAVLPDGIATEPSAWAALTTSASAVRSVSAQGGRLLHPPAVVHVARLVAVAQLRSGAGQI